MKTAVIHFRAFSLQGDAKLERAACRSTIVHCLTSKASEVTCTRCRARIERNARPIRLA